MMPMVIPNHSENKLVVKILDNLDDIKKYYRNEKYSVTDEILTLDNGYRKEKKFKVEQTIKFPLNYVNKIDGFIDLFENILGFNLSRFKDEETSTIHLITKISERKTKKDMLRKVKTKKMKANVKVNVLTLRSGCVEFLRWKVKDVKKKVLSIRGDYFYPYNKDGDKFLLNKETYLDIVDEIDFLFKYYNSRVSNATFDESIDYNVKRLMNQDITFKSHEEMRKENGG